MTAFLCPNTKAKPKWALASVALQDAYTDFRLSRQAMNCTPATLKFYANAAGVTQPGEVTARLVRQYLAGLESKADRTRHAVLLSQRSPRLDDSTDGSEHDESDGLPIDGVLRRRRGMARSRTTEHDECVPLQWKGVRRRHEAL